MTALQFQGVGVTFASADGAREVLRGIDLQVAPGERVALLGRSGSGKSTLLNLAAGLLRPTQGQVIYDTPPRVGYVFQDARLLPWLRLDQNLALVSPPEYHPDIPSALTRVGLAGRGSDYPGQLSLGMAQRASLARALLIQPNLLLLDEPFGALDELTAGELRNQLSRLLRQQPVTTLLVTHHPGEAVLLSDRVVVLGGQPTQLLGELKIDLPPSRDPDDEGLLRLVRELRGLIHTAD